MIVVSETVAHSPWGFGWEALVAIATFLLAAVTVWLAWSTRRLARETAADQRAQWRPLLLPVGGWEERSGGKMTQLRGIRCRGDTLRVRVRNSGRGPALHVRAQLDGLGGDPLQPVHWSLGALEAENIKWLQFDHARIEEQAQLLIDYQDLAGRHHVTASIIKRDANDLFLQAVQGLREPLGYPPGRHRVPTRVAPGRASGVPASPSDLALEEEETAPP
ncbi:hypothetical protein [Streptomyces sp. NPDC005538]|uniref:hypothetical protein n=1 Tax=unclassified Streptomyces TaxID=2593676 RepID=UPI0033A4DE9E